MNIIEIDSSESEDDFAWSDSPDSSSNIGTTSQWENSSERLTDPNHGSEMSFQNYPSSNNMAAHPESSMSSSRLIEVPDVNLGDYTRSSRIGETRRMSDGASYAPQFNGHGEHTQKRTLPSSFQSFTSKPSEHSTKFPREPSVSQQKEPRQVQLVNGSEVDLSNMANYRSKIHKLAQHMQKKTLPPSIQQTIYLGDNTRSNRKGETSRMSDGASYAPQFNGHGEHTQKRTLPSSFQSFTSKPSEHSIKFPRGPSVSQQKEPRQVKLVNGSEVDLSNMANYRSKIDEKMAQHMQNKTFPPSLQQTMCRPAAEGPIDYTDDFLMYKSTGAHRVLPPSLMNGKSPDNPLLVGSNDAGNRSAVGDQRLIVHDERAIYQEALQSLGQPRVEDDLEEGLLSVSLLKHQKIALGWMVQKEKSIHCAGGILADDQGLGKTISMIALIQKQRTLQSNFTSNNSQETKPEALNLDDDDDRVTEPGKEKQHGEDDLKRKQVPSTSVHTSGNQRPAAGTLVVCPASVLRQWARELDEKVASGAKLSVLIYHGGTRTRDPAELAKYDVVLTTYAIVTNEVPKQSNSADDDGEQRNLDKYEISSEFSSNKRKQPTNVPSKGKKKSKKNKDSNFDYDSGALARVRWFRVILDEAQTIKNHRTQVARACSWLRAKRRWCLSGTPIQNSIDDLYSYFRFLKYEPYSIYSSFCSQIKFPISKDATNGYKKLQAVLKAVLLRRTKGTLINGEPIINLPPKSVLLKKVDFSPEERSFYLKLEADSRQLFKKYAAAGTVRQNYASILLMLLRLRQACDHPVLVKGYRSDTVGNYSLDTAKQLPKNMLFNLLHQLEGSLAICRVCNDPPEDAVVTMCGHVFCYQCVSDRLTGEDNLCPAPGCKETIGPESAFSQATLQICISDQVDNTASSSGLTHNEEPSIAETGYISSKIKATLEILNSLCSLSYAAALKECNERDFCMADTGLNPEKPVKAIVFSQWTGMLDLLEVPLNQSLIQYRRLDGSMSLALRDKAVRDFNTDPEVTVMIMSLKAGNLGLNMVAACHVILLDLWWNPTTEDQAVDRAHRIGQTRPVIVSRLTIKDTVEDRILALQEEKRKMVSTAFGEDHSGGHATKLTVEDLRYLFQV